MNDNIMLAYARVWFAGKSPIAPGTCGSLAAILLAPIFFMPFPIWLRVIIIALIFWSGTIASTRASKILGKKDPSEVVIDEVLGQWLTCLPFLSLPLWGYVAAFVLFRLFDITKPWLIAKAEQLPDGLGIMMDDAVAGIFAMTVLGLLLTIFG